MLRNISHIFVEGKKNFANFLQANSASVTQLEFSRGSLKFESLNEILQKLPNLQKIVFDEIKFQVPETNQAIDPTTCQNLVELVINNSDWPNLFQVFEECHIINLGIDTAERPTTQKEIDLTSLTQAPKVSSLEASFILKEKKSNALEALYDDGSIDFELLKGISLECLKILKEKHRMGKCKLS